MLRDGPWLPVIGAALFAGVVGGFVGRWSAGSSAPASSVTVSKDPTAAPASTDDAAQLALLERRVHALERAGAARPLPAHVATKDDDSAPGARPNSADPSFQAAVRDAMEQANDDRRVQRNERTAARLTTALGLSDAQREATVGILGEVSQAMRDQRDGGGDADAGAATMADVRSRAEERFKGLLDSDQRAKYDALDASEKLLPWRQRGQGDGR